MNEKYLIVVPTKKIGGTNSSLTEFTSYLIKKRVDIDLICLDHNGNFKFDNCYVLKESKILKALISPKIAFKAANFWYKIVIIFLYLCPVLKYKICSCYLKRRINFNKYDTVIAYEEGVVTELISLIPCKNKIAWIHCDYKRIYNKRDINIYNKYTKIVCVSKKMKESFVECFPTLEDSTYTLYNLINVKSIINKSLISIGYEKKKFLIVSVGRLDRIKQFDKLPKIARYLKDRSIQFEWLLIGGGNKTYEKEIFEEIKRNDVDECFYIKGEVMNPYPYLLMADLVVCSSFSEACPYVIREAMVLNKFVLSSDFASSNEILNGYPNYYICKIEDFCEAIIDIYVKKQYLHIKKFDYESFNSIEEKKFDNLFDLC